MRKLSVGLWGAAFAVVMVGCGRGDGGAQGGLGSQTANDNGTVAVSNDAGTTAPARLSDAQVLKVKLVANQGEVDQANAALTCLADAQVKAFAQEMITDHTAAVAKVNALIAVHGSADSPESAALADVGKEQLKTITEDSQSGGCDQVYVKVQIQAHETVLALLDELLQPSAQAPDVQAEVSAEMPVVQMHLDMANELKTQVGIARASDTSGTCGGELTEGQVVKWLMVSNEGEVSDGQMVLKKAVTPEAKAFAQRMIDDHGAALARVQALAAALGITPQESEESQNKKIEGDLDDQILNRLQPPKFDLAYIDIEVLDHYGDLDTIDQFLLPSSCTAALKAEVQSERDVVAKHESIARADEPAVRAQQ